MVEVLRPSGTAVAKSPSTLDSALYAEQHLKGTKGRLRGDSVPRIQSYLVASDLDHASPGHRLVKIIINVPR